MRLLSVGLNGPHEALNGSADASRMVPHVPVSEMAMLSSDLPLGDVSETSIITQYLAPHSFTT